MDHRTLVRSLALPALAAAALVVAAPASANHEHTTSTFMGAKVNAGTVTHSTQGGKVYALGIDRPTHRLNALTVVPRAPNFCAFRRVSSNLERAYVSTSCPVSIRSNP